MEKIDPAFVERLNNPNIDYESIIKSGTFFKDEDFPPEPGSLFNAKYSKLSSSESREWKKLEWLRAGEIFKGQSYSVFSGIDPNDIKQGMLGNCYFLSALSALSEFPDRIKQIFKTQEINDSGIYAVYICINGEFQTIIVDDHFPYNIEKKLPAFSKAKENELWVLLAEKAWAKVNGSYENTIQGMTSEALRALSGAPCEFINHDAMEDESLWKTIIEADGRNYIICASAGKGNLSKEEYSSLGLVSDHAYAVLQAREVNTTRGGEKGERLLQLRNPWGHLEWTGDWSDKSSLWTPLLKKKLGYVDADDGSFFMSFEDYLSYYRSTTIAKIHDDYIYNSIKCEHQMGSSSLLKLTVTTATKGFVTCSQIQQRIMSMKYHNYETSETNMLLGKVTYEEDSTEPTYEFIEGVSGPHESLNLEFPSSLSPGEYLLFLEVDWLFGGMDQVVLNTYTKEKLDLEIVDISQHPAFLEGVLKSCALKRTDAKSYESKGETEISKYISINDSKANYGFCYYVNQSHRNTLVEKCIFTKMEGCKLLPPYTGYVYDVEVPPNSDKIVIIKKVKPVASYQTSYVSAIRRQDEDLISLAKSEKAKRIQFKMGGQVYDINFYTLSHDFGYFLLFENETESNILDANFNFQLDNLKFEDSGPDFSLTLEPGEKLTKKMNIVNFNSAAGYKYKYSYKIRETKIDEEEIIRRCIEDGQRKELKTDNESLQIYYYVLFLSDGYYWYFENKSDKTLSAEYNFSLTNMIMEDAEDDTWKIELRPEENCLKKLTIEDMAKQSSYKVKLSYKLSIPE